MKLFETIYSAHSETKAEALRKHRTLWNAIADNIHDYIEDPGSVKLLSKEDVCRLMTGATNRPPENHCFLCQYATDNTAYGFRTEGTKSYKSINKCEACPAHDYISYNETKARGCMGGLYHKWHMAMYFECYEDAENIARDIANIGTGDWIPKTNVLMQLKKTQDDLFSKCFNKLNDMIGDLHLTLTIEMGGLPGPKAAVFRLSDPETFYTVSSIVLLGDNYDENKIQFTINRMIIDINDSRRKQGLR